MNDPVEWAKSVAAIVKDYCGKALAPIVERLNVIEQRQPEKGEDGKSVTIEEVTPIIEQAVSHAVAKIPPPKDGKSVSLDEVIPLIAPSLEIKAAEVARQAVSELPRPLNGTDGKSVSLDELRPVITQMVGQAIESIPKPKDGRDGKGVTVDELVPILIPSLEVKAAEVALKAVADLPRPKDGIDGKSVKPEDVLPMVKGWFDEIPKPKDGTDGKSVTIENVLPYFQQAFDKWALDFERRAQDIHTRLLASFDKPKDGIDGEDGKDGLGFDDMEEEFDGERTVIRRYRRGDQVKEFRHKFPSLLERGVWKIDRSYERGDGVTFDGSYWIAQRDTKDKPGTSDAWRLAVKKGRDGKGS